MRLIILVLLSLALSACSSMDTIKETWSSVANYIRGGEDNSEPPSLLVEYHPELKINILWSKSDGVGAKEQSVKLVPAIGQGKIIVADRKGLAQARDLKTGKLIWEAETEHHFSAGPGLGVNTVILGTSDADLVALDIQNGKQLWKSSVTSEVLSVPVVAKGIVVVRTTDGAVSAFDEKTGNKLWGYEHSVPALSIRGVGTPLVYEDSVIVGYDNGKLMALRLANGKDKWETSLAVPQGRTEIERLVDLDVDPIEIGGTIYIGSYNGGVSAISYVDGEVQWRNEKLSSNTGLGFDSKYLYLSDSKSRVWQLEQRGGESLWQQKELSFRQLTAPVVYQDYVVVGDYAGYVHWLSTRDGRQLGRIQVSDKAIDAKAVVADGIVYVYASDGILAAITATPN